MTYQQQYGLFVQPGSWCWVCGRRHAPKWWYAPWMLQRVHIGSGSGSMRREEDSRAVVIGCPLCHMLHAADEDADPVKINGELFPRITNANMLWVKQVMDPGRYSESYLASVWMGIPPKPAPLPMYFESQYIARRGPREAYSH